MDRRPREQRTATKPYVERKKYEGEIYVASAAVERRARRGMVVAATFGRWGKHWV